MELWDTSCRDWQNRLLAGRPLVPDLPLFEAEAARALRVFKRLRLRNVHGQPRMEDAAGDWLFAIVAALFGSYDAAAAVRMIQEYLLLIPKKNSKTSSSALIMLTALILNRRPEAGYGLVAPTKEIADRSFSDAMGAIRLDTALAALFHIQEHLRRITHRRTGATLQVRAADKGNITGNADLGTLIDELHVLSDQSRAADLMLEMRGALESRPDGFIISISTQSKTPPAGIFKETLGLARAVRDGALKLRFLPVLYELPIELSRHNGWKNRAFWHLVNPNMGRSVHEDFLDEQLRASEFKGGAALTLFASQHFNVEIGLSLSADNWPGAPFWEPAAEPGLTLDTLLARADVVAIGVDGGGLDDMLAIAILGRDGDTGRLMHWGHAWLHRSARGFVEETGDAAADAAARAERIKHARASEFARYDDFVAAGDLTIVETMRQAFTELADLCERVNELGLLAKVGLDPFGVKLIVDELARRQISQDGGQVVGIPQGYKLQGIVKSSEDKLSDGDLVHCGQGLMAYAVGNLKVERRGMAILLTKQAAGSAKVDPAFALFDAMAVMLDEPEAPGVSIFDRDELWQPDVPAPVTIGQ